MSWSLSTVTGRPTAVLSNVTEYFGAMSPCPEPEETIRQSILSIIRASLSDMPATSVVAVSASGSQSSTYDPITKSYGADPINQVKLSIEPIWNFVE